ncbi:MAG: NAD(P)H-dependent oxidoreductase [Muribaculaceae bacterium]|nr:NAD(P)H-dependent oxidoreductase [Muribaculaceae bacterium]
MKTFGWIIGLALAAMLAVSCSPKKETQKMLVLYYSQTSNTKAVANEIATKVGADIEEVVAVDPYNGDFQATIERCMKERDEGIIPEIKPIAADIAKYDVIFIGYPIWFGTYAPPIAAMLDKVDLSGKKVVPFCTFGSGGLESSIKDLKAKQPKAEILDGYGVRAARMSAMPKEVDEFLKAGGFIEGECTKLEPFPEQHPVSEEETAIFNAAVGDYPMMNAQAIAVAQRNVPDGVEYLFTAKDLPREPKPDMPAPGNAKPDDKKPSMPPPGEMKVYVLVANGEAPVFTRVVR